MKVIVQKVSRASVTSGDYYASINQGYMILVGVAKASTRSDAVKLAEKVSNSRLFMDDNGKMNLSIKDFKGDILSISQFTLYADVKKGNRPSFQNSAERDQALELYHLFNETLKNQGLNVEVGRFGEMMDIELVNHGPITLTYESKDGKIQ